MVGQFIGGINVFGGGLALYDPDGALLGGLGVSGDSSCTDHIIAWKVRFLFNLDNVPGGVSPTGDDNLIIGTPEVTPNTFEHPTCLVGDVNPIRIINALPDEGQFPTGPNP